MTTMTEPRPATTGADPRRPQAQVLAAEISDLLKQLRPLANQVHDLVDSYQPTLAYFVDEKTVQRRNDAVREERNNRVDTKARPVGQQWMRGTVADPIGSHASAVRGQASSSTANTAFTLADLVGRLNRSLIAAGVGICVLPRFPMDPTIGHLAGHLNALVHHAATALPAELAIRRLRDARRELERLVDEADVVIDGTRQAEGGNCPHCGRPSIIIDFRAGLISCDVDRRTGQRHRCVCGDDYCLCRFHPVEFRHQWSKSQAGVKKDGWHRFKELRKRPDQPAMPPVAETPTETPSTTATPTEENE